MKLRRTKKGFTIVELVIVIAVIAVLSAVLIPTFISLNNKANKAADQAMIKNLDTALATKSAEEGRNNTMYEALKDAEEAGYKVENLKSKEGKNLVWNQETDRFEIVANNQANYKLWKVYKEVPSTQNFSIYLNNASANAAVTVSVGFDAGDNTSIPSVTYANSNAEQEVIIRTNSFTTNVEVDTEGSVRHFDKAGKLTVKKVAMSSFHEFGNVRTVELTKGNFVIESTGNVTLVSVKAAAAGDVKINNQGTLDVVAGNTANYEMTGTAGTQVDATVEDNTLAIVNGVAKTTLAAEDFGDGNKVILLKDVNDTLYELGSCEVVGNLTKFKANITGEKTIVLKNIHTTLLKNSNFTGKLTLDGGFFEYDSAENSNAESAAIYINSGYGAYEFKNMTIAANTNKGIKISKAKSVLVENCEFDASKLQPTASADYYARSLSAIDIQEQNGAAGKMAITIKDSRFTDVPQGSLTGNIADSDTAGAIKIKTEKAERSSGFQSVAITGNTFSGCYRDVVVGCNVYQTVTSTKEQADMDAPDNEVKSPVWTIDNNKTTLTESVVASRATLTYKASTASQSIAEKVGSIKGGCGVWETFKSARSWLH